MTSNELIKKITNWVDKGSMVVWCGAGISKPSGLPGADDLVCNILENTSLRKEERQKIANIVPKRLPFERLMEIILESMDEAAQVDILKIFKIGKPNRYHHFLAQLVEMGKLKTICTTNFDTHIETALKGVGLKCNEDYEVLYEPEKFAEIDWQNNVIRIIKLHGSVEELNKMAVTMRRVAAPGSGQYVSEVVNHLLGDGGHVGVLFIGYSFSDRIDISPVIQKKGTAKNNKYVVDLKYSFPGDQDIKVEKGGGNENHPLNSYRNNYAIRSDTGKTITMISKSLSIEDDDISDTQDPLTNWKSYLNNFFSNLKKRNGEIVGYHLAGSLLTMISADKEAVKYFRQVVELAKKSGEQKRRLGALQSLASSLIRIGETEETLSVLKKAEHIASKIEDGKFSDNVLAQFGSLYHQLGDSCYLKARTFYNSSLEVTKKSNDPLKCVPPLSGIAASWMKLGDFDAAQKAYGYARNIVDNSGDLYRKAEVYGNIASMAYILRDYNTALEWYKEARKISSLIGDTEREGIHNMNLANVYVKQKEYTKAFETFDKARELLESILWKDHPAFKLLDSHEEQAKKREKENLKAGSAEKK